MVETGDYTNINFQNTPRHKKPVGIYWLQSLSERTFDQARSFHISYFRLPSLIAALTAAFLFFLLATPIIGRSDALLATAVFSTTVTAVAEAHLATTDSALLLCAVATMTPLARAWSMEGGSRLSFPTLLALWIGLAGGVLIKGPVLPAIVTMGSLTYSITTRSVSWVRRIGLWWGLPLCVALILPWFLSIQSQTGGAFLANSFKGDIAPKLVGVHESHRGFPGFYTLSALISFWPWSFLLIPTLVSAFKRRRERALLPWLCWLVPSWIALEIVPTKLPHYSLPLFPALAVVCVLSLSSLKDAGRLTTISAWLCGALSIILGVVLVGAPLYFSGSAPLLAAVGALCAVGVAFLALSRKKLAFSREGIALPLLQAVIFFPILFHATLPNLGSFWSSRELTQVVEVAQKEIQLHSGANVRVRVASAGYGEPSFVFLNGTNTLLTDGAGAAKFLNETCDSVTLVTAKELAPFSDTLRALGRTPAVEGPTLVFNYSKGKWVSVYQAIRVWFE